ncbi:E3 ubiquitin-protein ligase SIRP1-like [Durio zibethinus]|uniref:E3 ubiquitin-protein ligase SIRP1-like n=1 Tax=Durio zibethinus TaxID=66656 RepID=A0A6P5XKM3_DURZI|nr:E3 ubiquitin-protein ligase SIRP1-like [Durio zibethinus]
MDIVKQIATRQAKTLNRLSNWGLYSTFDGSYDPRTTFSEKLDDEQLEFIKCETMTTRLAMSRARQTNRDYESTLMEVQLEVGIELAKILAETIDPAFSGTNAVKIEEDGQVCGICQEDMEKGEEARTMICCSHKFHGFCIFEWVKRKTNCPLCRCEMLTRKYFEF